MLERMLIKTFFRVKRVGIRVIPAFLFCYMVFCSMKI